jgi:signal transduction histidine kinase
MIADHPGFNCNLSLDLEKILPKVEVIPDEIRFVIFSLLKNAFESVRERTATAPKGYEPIVTVTTRKLPRFVQVRVKDNGIGIPDKIADKIFEPYFTTRQSEKNPGLGLTISKEMITLHHKGELFVESDFSNSTDFIIRFPTLTLM